MRDPRTAPLLTLAAAFGLTVVLLVALVAIGVGDEPAGAGEPGAGIDPGLLADLADGGEVLLFRHAITEPPLDVSPVPTDLADCDAERNLSPEGIEQSQQVGAALAALDLADGPFIASPFCRGVDTALAMLDLPTGQGADLGPVEIDAALRNTTGIEQPENGEIIADGLELLAARVGGPDTVVMISHVNNINGMVRQPTEEGDAVVIGAAADGALEVRGIIPADAW